MSNYQLPLHLAALEQNDLNARQGFIGGAIETASNFGMFAVGTGASILTSVGNLGVTALNVFGAEVEEFSTGTAMGNFYSLFGAEDKAIKFYEDHKNAIELSGLIVGSLIPGGLAVKGFRALQQTGKVTAGVSKATGLLNPKLHTTVIKDLTAAIRADKFAVGAAERMAAYRSGFIQNAYESAVYELATVAVLNRNPTLSKEEYGYLETFWQNKGDIALGIGLGTAIGGGFSAMVTRGDLKKAYQFADAEINSVINVFEGGKVKAVYSGDVVAGKIQDIAEAKLTLHKIETAGEAVAQAEGKKTALKSFIEEQRIAAYATLNSTVKGSQNYGQLIIDQAIKRFDALIAKGEVDQAKQLMETFAQNMEYTVGVKQLSPSALATKYQKAHVKIVDTLDDIAENRVRTLLPDSVGGVNSETNTAFLFKEVVSEDSEVAEEAFIMLMKQANASQIDSLFRELRKPALSSLKPNTIKGNRFVFGKSKIEQNKRGQGRKLFNQFRNALQEFDPTFAQYTKNLNDPVFVLSFPELASRQAEYVNDALKGTNLMNNILPKVAGMEGKKAKAMYPSIYRIANESGAIKNRFIEGKAYLNVLTGDIEDVVSAPIFRDLGEVSINYNKKFAQAGDIYINIDTPHLSFENGFDGSADAIVSAAHYAAAKKNPEMYLKARNKLNYLYPEKGTFPVIDHTDIPAMYALNALEKEFFVSSRKIVNGQSELVKVKINVENFREEMFNIKKNLAIQLRNGSEDLRKIDMMDYETAKGALRATKEPLSEQEIARIIDVDVRALSEDLLAYSQKVDESLNSIFYSLDNNIEIPNRVELNYHPRQTMDENVVRGAARRAMAEAAYAAERNNTAKNTAKELIGEIDFIESKADGAVNFAKDISEQDTTAGFVGASMGELGKGSGISQAVGKVTAYMMSKIDERITNAIQAPFSKLKAASNPEALAEFSVFMNTVARSNKLYHIDTVAEKVDFDKILNTLGTEDTIEELEFFTDFLTKQLTGNRNVKFLTKDLVTLLKKLEDSTDISELKRMVSDEKFIKQNLIAFSNNIAAEAIDAYAKEMRQLSKAKLANDRFQLEGSDFDADVFYPGKMNLERYKHVAIIELANQSTFNGSNRKGVIVAKDAQSLRDKLEKVEKNFGSDLKIIRPDTSERYFKAIKEYKSDEAMSRSFIDSALENKGILSDFMPEMADNIIEDAALSIKQVGRSTIRSIVRSKYYDEIQTLQRLDESTTLAGTAPSREAKKEAQSVYIDHIKQMLDISSSEKFESYMTVQERLDKFISASYQTIKGSVLGFSKATKPAEVEKAVENISGAMERFGLPEVYKDFSDYVIANTTAPTKQLRSLVAASQGILSTLTLRMDHAQAIVNSISVPILGRAAIQEALSAFKVPLERMQRIEKSLFMKETGEWAGDKILFQAMADSVQYAFGKKSFPSLAKAEETGIISSTVRDIKNANDLVMWDEGFISKLFGAEKALKWQEKTAELAADEKFQKLKKAAEIVSGISANDISETFTKAVGVRIADIIGEAAGLSAQQTKALQWNIMTRIAGNYTASQRPVMFQGWLGQSIGLFQTYSFNMMQTAYRAISTRTNKAFTGMLTAQVGLFGAQSIPGFSMLNSYIAKKTEGEEDFYTGIDSLDSERDFMAPLVYGLASGATIPIFGNGIDFFNRGNLTPRTPILIPTSPADIPMVSYVTKFLGSMKDLVSNVSNDAGVWDSTLFAISKHGINRPLQGAAELIQGYRGTNQANKLVDYETLDAWTIVSKLMGTRSTNEAILVNAYYRANEQRRNRLESLSSLGEAAKISLRGEPNGIYTQESLTNLMKSYAERGGRMDTFNQWVSNVLTDAHDDQLSIFLGTMKNPESRYLYEFMDN